LRARTVGREARGRGLPGERRATLPAKLSLRGILRTALGTALLERGAALIAKLGSFGILKAAAWTAHTASLLPLPVLGQEKRASPRGAGSVRWRWRRRRTRGGATPADARRKLLSPACGFFPTASACSPAAEHRGACDPLCGGRRPLSRNPA